MARNNAQHRQAPKWTAEEEDIILDEIGKSPTNIKIALLAAAERLPVRTYYACANHWYEKMAGREDVVGRVTIGRHTSVKNKTRIKPEQNESYKKPHTRNIWNRILSILFRGDSTNQQ